MENRIVFVKTYKYVLTSCLTSWHEQCVSPGHLTWNKTLQTVMEVGDLLEVPGLFVIIRKEIKYMMKNILQKDLNTNMILKTEYISPPTE